MKPSVFERLAGLTLPQAAQVQLGLPPEPLHLRRAWPRTADHLLLEYVVGDDMLVPGQWFRDGRRAQRTCGSPAFGPYGRDTAVVTLDEHDTTYGQVTLHLRGNDRKLPGLAPLLAQPGARLLVHRPERRAVVRLETSAGLRFAKVVPPERTRGLAAAGELARVLSGGVFATPHLIDRDEQTGVLCWSALPGVTLYDLPGGAVLEHGAYAAGVALRGLHTAALPARLAAHSAGAEIGVIETWLARVAAFMPDLGARLAVHAPGVRAALVNGEDQSVPIHRDFYDKQVFLAADGHIGLLDFDTLASGEAALDVANALVHFELRALQGRYTSNQAARAGAALLSGYAPEAPVRARLTAYAAATRLRLACVYAFRPRWRACSAMLIERLYEAP